MRAHRDRGERIAAQFGVRTSRLLPAVRSRDKAGLAPSGAILASLPATTTRSLRPKVSRIFVNAIAIAKGRRLLDCRHRRFDASITGKLALQGYGDPPPVADRPSSEDAKLLTTRSGSSTRTEPVMASWDMKAMRPSPSSVVVLAVTLAACTAAQFAVSP